MKWEQTECRVMEVVNLNWVLVGKPCGKDKLKSIKLSSPWHLQNMGLQR